MLDNVIETPEHLVWALDGGESGYIILARGDDSEYGRVAVDFTILTDMGYVIGTSLPSVEDKLKAGKPISVSNELHSEYMLEALRAMCSFLGAAAEKYTTYDMANKSDPEGDDFFNLNVRAWAYQNDHEITSMGMDLGDEDND